MTCTECWRQNLDKTPGLLIVGKCPVRDTRKRHAEELAANAGFVTSRRETEAHVCFIINGGEAE